MMRRMIRAAAAAGVIALLTTGCTLVDRAGAAAIVGGERLAESSVDASYASLVTALEGQQLQASSTEIVRGIVSMYVQNRVIAEAAARAGVTPSAAQIAELRQQLIDQVGEGSKLDSFAASQGVPPMMIDEVLAASVAVTDLGAKLQPGADGDSQSQAAMEYVLQVANEMSIEVAPRYGAWDVNQLGVGETVNDLSIPAAMLQG